MTPQPITAGLVLIGNELLSGKVRDENGPYLIDLLRRNGIDLGEIHVVADEEPAIVEAVNQVRERRTHCFTSGGIGPTHDDITMAAIAKAFDEPLEQRPELVAIVESFFGTGERGKAWAKMAWVPQSTQLAMTGSTWPIYCVDNVYVLPGIPEIFKLQADLLVATFGGTKVITNIIYTTLGEGDLSAPLTALAERYDGKVAIGSYPVLGNKAYRVKVTLDSRDTAALEEATAALLSNWSADVIHDVERDV